MSTNAHVRAPPERLVSKQRRVCPDGGNVRRESRLSCTVAGWCVYCVRSRQGDQAGHAKWTCEILFFRLRRAVATCNVTRPGGPSRSGGERGDVEPRSGPGAGGGRSDFDPRLVEHVELNQHLFSAARMGRCALP